MKAIYINIDPMLAAFAAWLKGGKVGPAPTFAPLPLAVTIPLGESAAIFCPSGGEKTWEPIDGRNAVTVDGQTISFWQDAEYIPEDAIAIKVQPGLSALAPDAKYWVQAVTGDTTVTIGIEYDDGAADPIYFSIPVLVRREQAQGQVDLVDFTPPAAALAAGTDLKGTKFNGNEIVAAAGTGALSAPAGA